MPKVDMKDKRCKSCGKGHYIETSHMDDWEGKLHCSKCGDETYRHIENGKT